MTFRYLYIGRSIGYDRTGIELFHWHFPPISPAVFLSQFEGFTSLTYREAADLCLATAERQLDGYHVFMPGSSRRHADLKLPELIAAYYPGLDPSIPDLIDNTPIADATGWQPDAFH